MGQASEGGWCFFLDGMWIVDCGDIVDVRDGSMGVDADDGGGRRRRRGMDRPAGVSGWVLDGVPGLV